MTERKKLKREYRELDRIRDREREKKKKIE
jgi:hypothetical protein